MPLQLKIYMHYGFGILGPTVWTMALTILCTIILALVICGTRSGSEMGVPVDILLIFCFSLHVLCAPSLFNFAVESGYLRLFGTKTPYWPLGLALMISIPISLWCLSKVESKDPEPNEKRNEFSSALRKLVRKPLHRVMYLFHYGILNLKRSFDDAYAALSGMSAIITHFMVSKFFADIIHAFDEDERLSASRLIVVIAVPVVGYISLYYFENQAHAIISQYYAFTASSEEVPFEMGTPPPRETDLVS